MKQTDRYQILSTTTNLLIKHMDLKSLEHLRGEELSAALVSSYNNAKNDLLSHINKQVEHIGTIEALTQCLVDACYGFGALGMRQDLLHKKLVGANKTGAEAMCDAIEKDVKEDITMWGIGTESNFSSDAFNLSNEAFGNNRFSLSSEDADEKALAFVYLLNYVVDNHIKLNLTSVAMDFQYFSCLRYIIKNNWAEHSLAGYFNEDGDYVLHGADTDFIGIFAEKLRELLAQAGTKRAEHFKSLQIKQYLHQLLIQAYSGCSNVQPLAVYTEIEQLIAVNESSNGITPTVYEDVQYSSRFAVTVRHSAQGVAYELDIEGLTGLADILEALGLISLQEVNVIVSKIKSCTGA